MLGRSGGSALLSTSWSEGENLSPVPGHLDPGSPGSQNYGQPLCNKKAWHNDISPQDCRCQVLKKHSLVLNKHVYIYIIGFLAKALSALHLPFAF